MHNFSNLGQLCSWQLHNFLYRKFLYQRCECRGTICIIEFDHIVQIPAAISPQLGIVDFQVICQICHHFVTPIGALQLVGDVLPHFPTSQQILDIDIDNGTIAVRIDDGIDLGKLLLNNDIILSMAVSVIIVSIESEKKSKNASKLCIYYYSIFSASILF